MIGIIIKGKVGSNDGRFEHVIVFSESRQSAVRVAAGVTALNKQETENIEFKLALSQMRAKHRIQKNLTQIQLAKLLQSSQFRVAKMERGDPTVAIDLLIKSLPVIGATKESLDKAI